MGSRCIDFFYSLEIFPHWYSLERSVNCTRTRRQLRVHRSYCFGLGMPKWDLLRIHWSLDAWSQRIRLSLYGLIFGIVGKIFGLAPEKTFHLSFYLGICASRNHITNIYPPSRKDDLLYLFLIIFLAFYHGTGESHGFFWVVPSFYLTALFIVLFHFITSPHSKVANYIIAALVSITYVFMHPMSIYIAFLFPLYLCTHFYLTKTYSTIEIKKVAFILLIPCSGSAGVQSCHLAHVSQLNYYGFRIHISGSTSHSWPHSRWEWSFTF